LWLWESFFFAIFLLANGYFMPVYGQNSAVDSLKRELEKHKEEDIKRLIILVELVKSIGSNDLQECEKLLSEAQKIRNILKNNYSIVKYYEGQINFDRFNDSHQEAIANSDKALTICTEENYKTEYYEILLLKALSLVRGDAIKETEKLLIKNIKK
jgi:hypothetical protein